MLNTSKQTKKDIAFVFATLFCSITLTIGYQFFGFNPYAYGLTQGDTATFHWELTDDYVKNKPVKLATIPINCQKATIAIEDRTFYANIGIDVNGIARTIISLVDSSIPSAGSTISQQLVKNSFQKVYDRDIVYKVYEMIYAIRLNTLLTKNEILEAYLNNIYYGNYNYGIASAALDYFGKDVQTLTLSECAYLAGLPQLPEVYNPQKNLVLGLARKDLVLQAMLDSRALSEEEFIKAKDTVLVFNVQ